MGHKCFLDLSHLSGHMYEQAVQMSENGRGVVGPAQASNGAWQGCGGACPGVQWAWLGLVGPAQVSSGHGRGAVGSGQMSENGRQCGEVWASR